MQGPHSDVVVKSDPVKAPEPAVKSTPTAETQPGKETFTSTFTPIPAPPPGAQPPPPEPEEEDDTSVSVSVGTVCRRNGCGEAFVSDQVSRHGDGPESTCVYHPKAVSFM